MHQGCFRLVSLGSHLQGMVGTRLCQVAVSCDDGADEFVHRQRPPEERVSGPVDGGLLGGEDAIERGDVA